jgi:hypothetical protein
VDECSKDEQILLDLMHQLSPERYQQAKLLLEAAVLASKDTKSLNVPRPLIGA